MTNVSRSRARRNKLDDPHEAEPSAFDDLKACRTHEFIHPVIDVLPGEADRRNVEPVHERADQGAIDPYVIEKKDLPAGLGHTAHLPQARNRVRQGAEDEGRHGRVEGAVREGEVAEVRLIERDVDLSLAGAFPGPDAAWPRIDPSP